MTPNEFNQLRIQFLNGNSTGAARLKMIEQLTHYQRELTQEQDAAAAFEAASAIAHAAQKLPGIDQYIRVDIAALVAAERERCAQLCEGAREVAVRSGLPPLCAAAAMAMATTCAMLIRST